MNSSLSPPLSPPSVMLRFVPFDFLIQTAHACVFLNWIYFYDSVTGSFHLTIFRGPINTYIPIIAALERPVSFNRCFLPGFSYSHRKKCPSMDMRANLCVVLCLFPSDARFQVELLNQKGMYILNFIW